MTSTGPDSTVASPGAATGRGAAGALGGMGEVRGLAIDVHGVWRSYAVKRGRERSEIVALQGVSLAVPAGQRVALLGPNGSGKSTLLRILATLDRPDSKAGTAVVLMGTELGSARGGRGAGGGGSGGVRGVRSRLGVVFQAAGLDELLTIEENLAAQASLYGLSGGAAAERIGWAAERLGLTDRMGDRVGTLSGGLARRVDLARALLHDPDLLLLDEPTTGLDPRAREEFLSTVDAVAGEDRRGGRARMTVVMSTHLMEEAQRAERVVLLHRGRIVADEAPDALRHRVGGIIIRCHAAPGLAQQAEGILAGAGVEVSVAGSGMGGATIVGRVREDRAGMEEALVGLVRAGVPFEVGPPTLGDVFLSMTGEGLSEAEAATANGTGVGRHRARRARR